MLYVIIALLSFVAIGYLIVKRVHAAAAIFFVGVILLMVAAALGVHEDGGVTIEPSGNALYDQLLVVDSLFKSRFAGIGMAIMVLFGFVAYMRHIGADAKTVVVLSKPLARMKGSYWLVPIGFILGNILSLVVPSASALSLLLIATLLPALVAAGLTPLTVGAIVVTSSTIVPTPLEAGLIQGASLTGMPISEYVFGHVARATVPTIILMAFIHMWWQRRCDRKDAARIAAASTPAEPGTTGGSGTVEDAEGTLAVEAPNPAVKEALERAAGLPTFYAAIPLLPLLLIVITATLQRLGWLPFEAGILPATIVSLLIAVIIEMIRHRNIPTTLDSMKSFFLGMGEGAGGVVALLVAAAVLVEGITQLGVIKMLTDATTGSHGAAAIIILIFVGATALLATLTGSGVAPYFAFSEFVPALAAESGILPVRMLNSIWGTSNLMRQVSPVAAAVLIVAGAIKVTPLDLVKRTAIPMIGGTILNVLFSFLFITA
ncbi:MAG: C4-dicarboxylate transporter DcuC [bacterium]|nr:C4-dicarboxylate transporter DcuC [bacterium]